MKSLLQDFVNILYPDVCPGCGEVYPSGEEVLCFGCQMDLPVFNNEQIVEHILGGRINISRSAIFLKFYSNSLSQRLLHQIKYQNNQRLGELLGKQFMLYRDNCSKFQEIEVVVPIPLHEKKLRVRGYNQSEVISAGIASVLEVPIDSKAVHRVNKSETQTRKSRRERWENVSDIFHSEQESLKGKHVLLVDDVITTGATMEACAQAVLDAGASEVSFAALATAMT